MGPETRVHCRPLDAHSRSGDRTDITAAICPDATVGGVRMFRAIRKLRLQSTDDIEEAVNINIHVGTIALSGSVQSAVSRTLHARCITTAGVRSDAPLTTSERLILRHRVLASDPKRVQQSTIGTHSVLGAQRGWRILDAIRRLCRLPGLNR